MDKVHIEIKLVENSSNSLHDGSNNYSCII